jgi:hypothetical protein
MKTKIINLRNYKSIEEYDFLIPLNVGNYYEHRGYCYTVTKVLFDDTFQCLEIYVIK